MILPKGGVRWLCRPPRRTDKSEGWVLVPRSPVTRSRVIPALRSHASELFEARQLLLRIQPDWLLSMLRLLRRGCHRQGLGIGRASVYSGDVTDEMAPSMGSPVPCIG